MNRLFIIALCATAMCACRQRVPAEKLTAPAQAPATETSPSRIVLFIGDGMGVGQLTAAMYAKGERLSILQMPHVGLMTTHEHEFLTTDSAASATAISTGRKATFEAVSVTPGTTEAQEEDASRHMQTVLELAGQHGLRTGLVSTSRVNHATGAAFGAHRFDRHQYEQIASDFVKTGIDVLIGPGEKNFTTRADGRDLLAEMREAGWATAQSVEELDAVDGSATRVAALLHPKDYPFLVDDEARAMPLPDMVDRAIEVLDRGKPKGWMLVVEGSFVDWCAHNLDGPCAAMEVLDLDSAVARTRAYASKRRDTLVVVTADHETGGMSVIDPYYADRFSKILGGEAAAAKMVALPNGADAPPPFQHIAIGASSAKHESAPLPNPNHLGMTELVDGRASLVFGHFSVASRAHWKSDGRFYAAHTPAMVTIHAEGPAARSIVAVRDNAELGRELRRLVANTAVASPVPPVLTERPRNVVLMIGDGMGVPSVTAGHYASGGLQMLNLPVRGLVSTHASDYLVNDSGATATTLATGYRTRKKSIGKVIRDGEFVASTTVLEEAERRGLATGIVTTTPVTHATPAAFYAHQDSRYEFAGIVGDLLSLPKRAGMPEVVFGGGAEHFDEATRENLRAAGYAITTLWPPPDVGNVIALLAEDGLLPAGQRANDADDTTPTLAEMTEVALDRVDNNPNGFFLLVEGGQIDWRLHEGVLDRRLIDEVVDFDDAVAAVRKWAEGRPDTLVIVTADHDHTLSILDNHYAFASGRCGVSTKCGGPFEMLPIKLDTAGVPGTQGFSQHELQGDFGEPQLYLQYAWPVQVGQTMKEVRAPHSANFVPLFAEGPWAHRFGGFQEQPAIGQLLQEWAGSAIATGRTPKSSPLK